MQEERMIIMKYHQVRCIGWLGMISALDHCIHGLIKETPIPPLKVHSVFSFRLAGTPPLGQFVFSLVVLVC